jgi:hypothetical protein
MAVDSDFPVKLKHLVLELPRQRLHLADPVGLQLAFVPRVLAQIAVR